jgi:hypothetical protein
MMRSRSWRRLGGWAALFALSLQIVLAFGHTHPLFPAKGPTTAASAALHSGANGPDKKTGDAAQDICAICVSIHLASALVLPQAAVLATPARTVDLVDLGGSEFVLPRLPPHPFRTRAPPSA